MSTDDKRRRLEPADLFQASGLLLVTMGALTWSVTVGLVTAGVACLWIGWSQT